jgi:hypothetical protein
MTVDEKKARSARTRAMTAARKSLTLIAEGAAEALAVLGSGGIPQSSITASVAKYAASVAELQLLDAITAGAAGDPEPEPAAGNGVPAREDVALLVSLALSLPGGVITEGTALARLAAYAYPGEDREGLPPVQTAAPAGVEHAGNGAVPVAATAPAPVQAPPASAVQVPVPGKPSGDDPYDPARESVEEYAYRRGRHIVGAVTGQSEPQG